MKGKHIVLGITGSIAAYKACTLVRLLVKAGAEVQVVMTPSAKEFITPLTLATLSRNAVVSEFFDRRDGSWHSHVDLGLWADAMVIAPASAATIGKMAHGIADNMLLTTYLSMKAPVFVAPAMDLDMFQHQTTTDNLERLRSFGHHIIEPQSGELASALIGKGRMEEPEQIMERLTAFFQGSEEQKRQRILITAGPTYERLDPVRFVGNYSTGKMGFALAESCARQGFEVELIAGPVQLQVQHPLIHRTNVESAAQMHEAATRLFPSCQAAILCAAVADFTPAAVANSKIKRETTGEWRLELVPTRDIARDLGTMKQSHQVLVGFALETDNEQNNALEKMQRKQLDCIVLNSLRDEGAGFGHDTNKVTLIDADGTQQALPLASKQQVADEIIRHLCDKFL
ncbi:MAG: bifunctional phosphopantothenoylcysteine decarboxylase/phosphopantothenate--cysteine ligase CoaBC [Bacteroidales bacterium]|nr:bifunctional phosphopantothenoylcysteine decarboxylase/phosphopantothenate--cysteine ligase CoaBC [Bacteroidales bacterium]